MGKIKTLAAVLVCFAILASGCAESQTKVLGNSAVPAEVMELQNPRSKLDFTTSVAKGANDFAFAFSAELARRNTEENFVCSPFSAWLPLAALINATFEPYREELIKSLGIAKDGIEAETVNTAASRMLYDLTNQREKEYDESGYISPLKIANAVFVGKDMALKAGFAQAFADYFRGNALNVDFASNEAVDAVNRWASENTEGLIKNIVGEFDPKTVVAIANAVYFSDRWSSEFNPDETREDVFHSPSGEITAQFMIRGDEQSYYEDEKVQAVPMSFIRGGGLCVMLPKDGDALSLLTSLNTEYFDEIYRDSERRTGKLLLPRFKAESGVTDLTETLKALGVPLFDKENAPLTGGLLEEDVSVWVSSAAQKSYIEIDEKGATAAAVTIMEICGTAMPQPTEPFEMVCDRPFVFILYGNTYDGGNQVLFTGIVNNP